MAGSKYEYRLLHIYSGVVADPNGPVTSGLDMWTPYVTSGVETKTIQDVIWTGGYLWANTYPAYASGVDDVRATSNSVLQEMVNSGQSVTVFGFESGGTYKTEVLNATAEQRDFYLGRMRKVYPEYTISGLDPDSNMTISGLTGDPVDWEQDPL